MRPSVILSTCGTSVLTNGAGPLAPVLLRNSNQPAREPGNPDHDRIQAHLDARVAEMATAMAVRARELSAEINGLLAWYGPARLDAGDLHFLLATDTWLGFAAATMVADWLRGHGARVEVVRQRDLATDSLESFRVALSDLVLWCDQVLAPVREGGQRVVFNLTGGFKSVNGFLQTLGAIHADETFYLFQAGHELMRIPRLPLSLDALPVVAAAPRTFRRLALQLPVSGSEAGAIPETFLLRIGDQLTLSEWGQLVWRRARRTIYAERLLESPSDLITFGPTFVGSASGLAADRLVLLNERLDDLARFVETAGHWNPRSLDWKALRGDPAPPSTHECDAWSDGAARRLYGRWDGPRIVLDRLGSALH